MYRRRRLVLLLAVVAVVAGVVWLLVAQPWRVEASETAAPVGTKTQSAASALPVPTSLPSPAATDLGEPQGAEETAETPSETPSATPAAQACIEGDIAVEALVGAESYAADENPQFSIRLTNSSAADCTLNVGTSGQAFTVMSGSDTWWRSTDCQSEPSDMVVLLAAGQAVTSASALSWDRTRSAVGTCGDETRPRAPGGGASYHLSVEIGGIPSTQSAQFLLY